MDSRFAPLHTDDQADIQINLKGFQPSTGGSGHVPPGNYVIEAGNCAWQNKRGDKQGRNLHLPTTIVEPAEYKGVALVTWLPAPDKAEDTDVGYRRIRELAYSLASYRGNLEAVKQADAFPFGPTKVSGKRMAVQVRDGKGEYANRSEIARFITKEEFEANPGPVPAMAMTGPAQTSTPEVLPANGSAGAKSAKTAVDQALFG